MPGLSLAGIDIGMDINTVLMILGNESRRVNSEEEINFGLVYEHKADAFLGIYFYEGKVSEISIMTMMCEDNGILPIKIRTVNEDIFRLSKQDVESIYGTGFYKSQDISLSVRKECNGKKENTTIYDYLSGIEFTFNEKSQYVKRVIVKRNLIPWVLIPAGNFDMGCNSKNESCKSDEIPLHPVNLNSYYIGKYEVTQALWTKVMGTNPSSNKNCENCPVENVNQYDIQEFLIKLNKKTGLNYRLPTEAEWEYAARGGNLSRVFNKYAGSNSLGAVAWHFGNSGNKTHPVGLKQANELGIHDMSGNVWEWCSDYYNENYYRKSPQKNPKGPSNGSEFIIRGGSFYGSDDFLFRSTNRRTANPNSRYANGGFRLAHDSF
jgi:formylglycine-generating enzyme required for sulfatase activity